MRFIWNLNYKKTTDNRQQTTDNRYYSRCLGVLTSSTTAYTRTVDCSLLTVDIKKKNYEKNIIEHFYFRNNIIICFM